MHRSCIAAVVLTLLGLFLAPALAVAGHAAPDAGPLRVDIDGQVVSAPISVFARGARDSLIVFGGPGTLEGKFEDVHGSPDRQGWEGVDHSVSQDQAWQIATFNAANLDPGTPDNHAWWCGHVFESCDPDDPVGGYGNDWNAALAWGAAVADPGAPVTVNVTAQVNVDLEPGYDYLYLEIDRGGAWQALWSRDGMSSGLAVDVSATLAPGELAAGQVGLRWRVATDAGWSDEDCFYPSSGACQIDLIAVTFDQGAGPQLVGRIETAEPGAPSAWAPVAPLGVGDFSHIWSGLGDLDVCFGDPTPVLAFIDDGVVVPGTGGSPCVDWCYGPDGWIVNPTGGLVGDDARIHNLAWSPPIALPGDLVTGARLEFDVYLHNSFNFFIDAGIFMRWQIDSTADPTGQTGWSGPRDENFFYEGGPGWRRRDFEVGPLLVDHARLVRIGLGVQQADFGWGGLGVNGTPAPYFDNVRLTLHGGIGPVITLIRSYEAQDTFPAAGVVDFGDLGAASVPIDGAGFVDPYATDPERFDAIQVRVRPMHDGAAVARPRLHYAVAPNPVFDPYRTAGWPLAGEVEADSVGGYYPYAFSLPDEGFLFPGDVMHYYITAAESFDGQEITSILPADTTGFGRFRPYAPPQGPAYASAFTMRALPTILTAAAPLAQPPVLVIDRTTTSPELDLWQRSLAQAGYREGRDYDVFRSHGGADNGAAGIGTVATLGLLAGYQTVVVVASATGALAGPGEVGIPDGRSDTELVDAWLTLGGRGLIVAGEFAVGRQEAADPSFVADWIGGTGDASTTFHEAFDGQLSPPVVALPDAPLPIGLPGYRVSSCQTFYTNVFYDRGLFAPMTATSATVLAEFTGPDHAPGAFPYAAIMVKDDPVGGSRVLALNHGLAAVVSDSDQGAPDRPLPARALLVAGLLSALGAEGGSVPVAAPEAPARLQLAGHPNPFNPRIILELSLPRDGHVAVDIFDVRGRKVRALLADDQPAGVQQLAWDGTDNRGRAVGAGLYFARLRTQGGERVLMVTMLK
ncbi:MAG: FlgD immunoglobulin-like domain containing protein [Candidatus Krumholzibacteriia bacterium]